MNIKDHYDLLIEENNDPFRDPPALRQHMESWDGQVFLDLMELDPSKTVLEIGVGTGRIAEKTAGCCRHLTGIDISPKTIERAGENLRHCQNITLICDDFTTHIFQETYDVIYSTLTMMHFQDKSLVIGKISALLNDSGLVCLLIDKNQSKWIDTDYFSLSDEEEQMHRRNLLALKAEQDITDDEFYHYDTPLTVKHESEALVEAGFSSVEVLNHWGATYTIKAVR